MATNIPIKKNQIYKDGKVWIVELFEYFQNGIPMYSVFDAFKTKRQAINIAKIVNRLNQNSVRDKLLENPKYLA